jgi:hypothetical protein
MPRLIELRIRFQLIADFGRDARLLELGGAFERARPWAHRWPAPVGDAQVNSTLA